MKQLVMRALYLALLAMSTALISWAQITGDLQILVRDASGAGVPNAAITVRNIETGAARSASASSDDGSVRVTQLGIGEYEVSVTAEGFSKAQTRATVSSGSITTVPLSLEVQGTTQEVIVTDSALAINTVNAQLQTTATSKQVLNLPIATSTGVLGLAATAPGVVPVSLRNPFLGQGSFNSNGGRGRANNITLDNSTATDVSTTGSAGLGTVPLEGIQEFNIITNQFTAEYGRNASAQVQILTKSGTNAFHGTLFEYFRNDKLNARDYFDRTGMAAILRENKWGAVVGGPIVKNKFLVSGTYEQLKTRGSGGTRVATVPRPDQVANAVPTSAQYLTQLRVPTDPSGTVSNAAPLGTDNWAYSAKGDWIIGEKDQLFVRYGNQDSQQNSPGNTFINNNLPNGASSANSPHNATASYTHAFGPSTVNVLLASFGRSSPIFTPLFDFGGPEIVFSDGTANFGLSNILPQGRIQNTYQLADTLTHVIGSHQLKFGADINRIHANSHFDSNVRGTFTFATLADFTAGRPAVYSQRFGNSVRGNRVWNEFFFLQDDWKVSPSLTLNLGIRLEVAHGPTEVNGIQSNLNLDKNESLGGAGTGPLGGFDVNEPYFETNFNWGPRVGFAWSPGGSKNSIRGGYGIAYDFIFLNPITNGRFLPPYMYNFSLPGAEMVGDNSYERVAAGTSRFQQEGQATVGTFGTTIRNFGSLGPIDQALKNPQTQQWSLSIEREVLPNTIGRVSYSGTKSNFLQRTRPINLIAPGVFTPPTTLAEEQQMQAAGVFTRVVSGLNAGLTSPTNRIDPRFTTVGLVESSANSNYHSFQMYLAKRFTAGLSFTAAYTWAKSVDDASDALGVLVNDTAVQQDPRNNADNRAVSQFDIPHRLVVTHLWEPQWFSTGGGLARAILGGWQFNGLFQVQSGAPVNFQSGARLGMNDPSLLGLQTTGAGVTRPNLVGPLNVEFVPNPGLGAANPNKVTNSGLAQPLVGNLGNAGRNIARVNRFLNYDWTLGKEFGITEQTRIQVQAQFYNLFNNTTFSRPGLTLSAPATFGYYTDTDTNSRNITLVMRLIW